MKTMRALAALNTVLLLCAPVVALDCLDLVDQYQEHRAAAPPDAMPDVFPKWKGAKSLPFTAMNEAATLATDLICDAQGEVKQLRFAFGWEGTHDVGQTLPGVVAASVLADPFVPGDDFVARLFEQTAATLAVEEEDFPGPYRASLEASLYGTAGGVVTLIVERD